MKTNRRQHILFITVLSVLIILTGVSCTRVKAASDTTWVYNAGIGRESRDFHYVVGEGSTRKEAEENALEQIAYEVCGASESYSYDDGKDSIFRFEYSTFLAEDEIASLRKRVKFAEYAKDDDGVYYVLAEIAKDDFLRDLVYKKLEENGIESEMAVDLTVTTEYESHDEVNTLFTFIYSSSQTGSVLSSYFKDESDEESVKGLDGISCPGWVNGEYESIQDRYYSIGVADSVIAAMANSRSDMAQFLSSTITHYENSTSEKSIFESSVVLADTVLEDVWIDADGYVYVLMSMPVEFKEKNEESGKDSSESSSGQDEVQGKASEEAMQAMNEAMEKYFSEEEQSFESLSAPEEANRMMEEAIKKYFSSDTENAQTNSERQNENENN